MRGWAWVFGILLGLLPVKPLWFAGGAALVGLYALLVRRERPLFGRVFLAYVVLGAGGQLLAPDPLVAELDPPWTSARAPVVNWIPRDGLSDLRGWNPKDGAGGFATLTPDGFWRVPRVHPRTGRPFTEVLSSRKYPVRAGEVVTESFYFRHDGTRAGFHVSFFTARGHHPVPVRVVELGNGWKRAYASYEVQPGDRWVRAVDLVRLEGDWTYLEIGYAQLEPGPAPSAYVPGSAREDGRWARAGWWLGTGVLGLLVLHGSRFLLGVVGLRAAGVAVLLGFLVHAGVALEQYRAWSYAWEPRVVGWTIQPNFLGHLGVVSAALVWVLAGSGLGAVAFGVALGLVWLSKSRAALVGALALGVGWGVTVLRVRRGLGLALLVGVLGLAGFLVSQGGALGRLGTVFDPSYGTTRARLEIWGVAWRAFLEHPLTGIGVNRFEAYYAMHRPSDVGGALVPHAHNLVLGVLAEGGALGFLGFVVLWGSVVLALVRRRAWPAVVLVGVAFVLNLADYTWFAGEVYYPLWVGVAAALRGTRGVT